ncbi:hypothetical protein CEP52_005154 [Fusarium oligoseptatum]|uniref:Uncharacterized protein n=2 Tax=Fusarium solani species complex TaxID=232080 RepID=A0A428TZZ6_9HYPO|nr:hypothetical protein CEP51_009998 [Fusarium floridanum]RSM07594.1 hypothetical protein CEP52_005154 [Fusarium oligoseptatum]
MATPFISLLEPGKVEGFEPGVPLNHQPSTVPQTFLDAMEVRQNVFVEEQKVPAENEFDSDDNRSCHWVTYASVKKTDEPEIRDKDGNILQHRKSSTRSTPIGTIRLVPFPHDPHPQDGGRYVDGILQDDDGEKSHTVLTNTIGKPFITERATTFHDGQEPYVKLGRLAVIKEFRGRRIAGMVVKAALAWIKANPSYFDPSIKEVGMEQLGAANDKEIPVWKGLVCVHAQKQVVDVWKKWGFEVDEGMGTWWEEGMPHVGMFQRLDID